MPTILLDPCRPELDQLALATQGDRIWSRAMPELSIIAEKLFACYPGINTFTLVGTRAMHKPLVDINNPEVPDTPPINSKKEVALPDGSVYPREAIRKAVPVRTTRMDPRQPPWNGNPEALTAFLAQTLAKHVVQQTEAVEAAVGRLKHYRTTVTVFGEIPVGHHLDPLGPLTSTSPLLVAKVNLVFEPL